MTSAKGIAIFDLDDCLVMNIHHYWACKEMFKYVLCNLGFHEFEGKIVDKLSEFDAAGEDSHGFTSKRFPSAMVETYEFYCSQIGLEPDENTRDGIYDIGMSVYRHKPVLYPGALELLELLKARGYKLACVTKGDEELQLQKLERAGIGGYFDCVVVVPSNKREAVQKLLNEHSDIPKSSFFFVGNSLKTDMAAALDCGITGIWIPCYTWDFEEVEDESFTEGMLRFESLTELLSHFQNMPE